MRRLGVIWVVALALSGVLGMSACTMWKEPKVATWKNITSVEAMERLLWQEVQAGNWAEVEAHMASNFTMSTQDGVFDKAQTLERLRKTSYDYSLGEFSTTDAGDTTILTYRVVMTYTGPVSGTPPKPLDHRRMSVWQKQKSGWVLIGLSDADLAGHFNLP